LFSATSPARSLPCLCNDAPPTQIYTLSLHDALPISLLTTRITGSFAASAFPSTNRVCGSGPSEESTRSTTPSTMESPRSTAWCRSEEHTSELQSRFDLVCRLLLEKKNKTYKAHTCA